MRTAVDRGMLTTTPANGKMGTNDPMGPENFSQDSIDMIGAFWRYRWAVILPAVAGAIIGFLIYLRTPETHRSTTRLMLESDSPAIFDTMKGQMIGGLPSIDIIESQLYGDKVVSMAFDDPKMQPYRERFGNNRARFIHAVQKQLILEPEVTDTKSARSLVMLLHFDSADPELCKACVESFSTALQAFFDEKQKSSHDNLMQLITVATDRLHPKMVQLEKRYAEFRKDAPLAWNSEGVAINPHREQQLMLVGRQSQLYQEKRAKEIVLKQVETLALNARDPVVALTVIGQMLKVPIRLDSPQDIVNDMREADETLGIIQVDKELIPVMIQRNQYAAQFGENHPTVKQLDTELTVMKSELKRIVKEQTDRIVELMKQNKREVIDPRAQAAEAVAGIIHASRAEVKLVTEQIEEVKKQIATENIAATKLAKYEQDNLAMNREIDRTRQLLSQLEDQMGRVSLMENSGYTRVTELTAPTRAYLIGPMIIKMLGIGTFLGIALGAGLALLLEKNSSTFRNPDEIAELLGTPVLTHVPFFKGRIRKAKKGEINPYRDLDPYLAVVHQPASVVSEAIRSFRTTVFFELGGGKGGKVLQVTSPLPGDGKSTIAGNLACSIAQSGKRVLAIDCDLRRPQLTDNFAMADQTGISNVLNGDCEAHEASHPTPLATLRVMPSGPIPSNPAEALTLPDMGELLELVRSQYDYIVLDTPPLLVVTDPSITASMVDGVVLTLRIRRKSKPNAKESINILRAVGANIMGVVINNSDEAGSSDGYRGYGYYRYGRYTSRYYRRSGGGGNSGGKGYRSSSRGAMTIKGRGSANRSGQNGSELAANGSANGAYENGTDESSS